MRTCPLRRLLLVALAIATVKAALVALYFMHLISEKQVVLWVLLLAAIFLAGMFALFIGAYADQEDIAILGKLTLSQSCRLGRFHIVFIAFATVLSFLLGLWALNRGIADASGVMAGIGLIALISGIILVFVRSGHFGGK